MQQQKDGMASKQTWTNLWGGPTRTPKGSTSLGAGASSGLRQFQMSIQSGRRHWEQSCGEGLWNFWWKAEHNPTSQWCTLTAQKVSHILGFIKRHTDCTSGRQFSLSLFWFQVWVLQHKKDVHLLEWVQKRASRMIWSLEHLSCEKDLIRAFHYLKGDYKKEKRGLFCMGKRWQDEGQCLEVERGWA